MSGTRLLIIDATTPKPYSAASLLTDPIGGSEATCIRVAEGLAEKKHYRVTVAQHNRETKDSGYADYVPLDGIESLRPDAVIMMRKVELMPYVQKKFPSAKKFLWMQDFNQQDLVSESEMIQDSGLRILGVSRTHKTRIIDALLTQVKEIKGVTVDFVYNAVPDDLGSVIRRPNPNKLVFFSSPHKGLENTLKIFGKLRELHPEFELHIANPGYYENKLTLPDGVVNHGMLTHAAMMEQLSDAFAVFHLNDTFPETFGIVHAEACALGIPTITAGHGANREILGASEFIVNIKDTEAVIKKVEKWMLSRPTPVLNPELRLSAVLNKWNEVLEK